MRSLWSKLLSFSFCVWMINAAPVDCDIDDCNQLFIYPETISTATTFRCKAAGQCNNLVIYSSSTSSVRIVCTGEGSCDGVKIYCGKFAPPIASGYSINDMDNGDATCDLLCDSETGYSCNNTLLSCKGNINNCAMYINKGAGSQLSTLECNVPSNTACKMNCNQGNNGCLNNKVQCHLPTTGTNCQCNSGCSSVTVRTSVTYNPTSIPTNNPTINNLTFSTTATPTLTPSSIPTTSIPTTSIPATSTPSTSIPTTLTPTTSMPTTSIPTTSMPTTSIPTSIPTLTPTTSVPSTSIPITLAPTSSAPITLTTNSPTTVTEKDQAVDDIISTFTRTNYSHNNETTDSLDVTLLIVTAVSVLISIIIVSAIIYFVKRSKKQNKSKLDTVNIENVIELGKSETATNISRLSSTEIENEETMGNEDNNHDLNKQNIHTTKGHQQENSDQDNEDMYGTNLSFNTPSYQTSGNDNTVTLGEGNENDNTNGEMLEMEEMYDTQETPKTPQHPTVGGNIKNSIATSMK